MSANSKQSFDLVRLNQSRLALKESFPKVIEEYLEDGARHLRAIQAGLVAMNASQVVDNAHPLKSSSNGFGASRLAQLAAEIEEKAIAAQENGGDLGELTPLLPELEEAFQLTQEKLQKFIGKIS